MASFGSWLGGLTRKVFGGGTKTSVPTGQENSQLPGRGGKELRRKFDEMREQRAGTKTGSAMPGPGGRKLPPIEVVNDVTPKSRFLGGEIVSVTSSNVKQIQYAAKERLLFIGFHNGGWYGYQDISEQEAEGFFNAGSKGKWVWDVLRIRGTVFGHRKEYFFMDAMSTSALPGGQTWEPKWHQSAEWRKQHGSIPASGDTPVEWKAGAGPYPSWYG